MTLERHSSSAQPALAAIGSATRVHKGHRRWPWVALGGTAILSAVILGVWLIRASPIPEPPLPVLDGADEEVAEAVQEARAEVLRQRASAAAWGRLGEILLAHVYNREANQCFEQAERLDPRDPEWPYLRGVNLALHDPEAGIPCLQRAAQRCGDGQLGPRLFLAEVYLDRGRLDEGRIILEEIAQANPEDRRARMGLGRLALLRQEWKTGLAHLEACQSDLRARKRAHLLCSEAWSQLGDAERARAELLKAKSLPEDRPWPDPLLEKIQTLRKGLRPRLQSAQQLVQAGRAPEAVNLLNQTLEKYPQSLEGWMRLGEVWYRLRKFDRAQECFQRAAKISPEWAEAWFRLGCAQAVVQRHAEAVASFRQALQFKANYAQAHYNMGQCLKTLGDSAGAISEFEEALRCSPDYELARTALGELRKSRHENSR
jgi:tetratricopeptide (TPR) repeat protein